MPEKRKARCPVPQINKANHESRGADATRFARMEKGTHLVILDRDGTINIERNYLASVEGMELLPGAAEAIRMINQLGCPVVVISNQPVVARGDCSLETLHAIHQRMSALLADEGAAVNAIYFCPHSPEDHCACRKPNTELLEKARDVFHADLSRSFVVGDKCSDIQAGRNTGAMTFLVRTGHGLETERAGQCQPHHVVNDLKSAAERICDIIRGNIHDPASISATALV
ncbi:MAG TPA: D-glycero-beta-D-manno-heptose 1,7-bisphosphate 7-phosphatase [Bryobacteraceae bacterium]|nr:D-glycero-beta-D-manno-heptose 1,7-bisphosphate 7-phosphatase [Bryobacteraceae bacterium]